MNWNENLPPNLSVSKWELIQGSHYCIFNSFQIKSEQSKRSQHSKQISDNEIRISNLLKKFQSEMESKNLHLSSEIETLKVEVEGKLERVAEKIPNLGSQLDVVSASAIETNRYY